MFKIVASVIHADASLLSQQLEGRLASADYLQTAVRFRLAAILYAEEAICDIGTFAFAALQIFSAGGRNLSAVAELLCFIERL